MKKSSVLLIVILSITIGFFVGWIMGVKMSDNKLEKQEQIIHKARLECIELNKWHLEQYKTLNVGLSEFSYDYERYLCAGGITALQKIAPELLKVNKALKIDCKQYSESGEVVTKQGNNGQDITIEILPTELKIEKD